MSFLILALIIIAVIIGLFFVEPVHAGFVFDTEKSDMNMTILWFHPLLKIVVTVENTLPVMSFYLFNKKVFKKSIRKTSTGTNNLELVRIINPKDVCINTNYGSIDPYITGIICGAVGFASQFINIDSFKNHPDFATEKDYIYFNATAKINLGEAFINYLRQTHRRKQLWTRTQT